MSAPAAASLEATIRYGAASRVREQLANATEGERRVLAKALKPLFQQPPPEDPDSGWQGWRGWHTSALTAA